MCVSDALIAWNHSKTPKRCRQSLKKIHNNIANRVNYKEILPIQGLFREVQQSAAQLIWTQSTLSVNSWKSIKTRRTKKAKKVAKSEWVSFCAGWKLSHIIYEVKSHLVRASEYVSDTESWRTITAWKNENKWKKKRLRCRRKIFHVAQQEKSSPIFFFSAFSFLSLCSLLSLFSFFVRCFLDVFFLLLRAAWRRELISESSAENWKLSFSLTRLSDFHCKLSCF